VELPLMVASAAYMVGFAFDASWYLRALERTRLLLAINAGVRLLCIVVLVAVVTQVATMWSAMWVYALVSLLTSGITWWLLLHQGLARRAVVELRFIGAPDEGVLGHRAGQPQRLAAHAWWHRAARADR
jgi:hypothetical protein